MRSKCSFFSIMLIFILAAAAYDPICEEYYRSQDVWLMGEAPDNSPFASQYLAILAYIPTAIVLNSYLVVSDLSVQEPIRRSEAVIGWQSGRAPFSSFFDFERYEKYWSNHHVKIISASSYSSCFTTETETAGRLSHTLAELVRVPEFLPYARRTFNILIDYANFTAGRKLPPFPFPPHHQIRIKSRFKMAALYSFWNDTTPLLSYVLASLKPAAPIQAAADALVRSLPRDFIAVHVRLDDEGLEELATSTVRLRAATAALSPQEKETMLLTEIVAAIRDSSCLQESFKAQAISGKATTLYLVTNYKPSVPSTKLRTVRLYDALRKLGTFDVVTRKTLAHRIVKDKEKRFNSELRSAVKSMSTMSPEHWSFIDMLVSDQSFCFLPSPISSLTSYVIERQRKLSRKILEKYDDINAQTYGAMHTYRDWGF